MIVVDTNVVSELMRSSPSPAVLTWVASADERQLHTTSVTVAEIQYGIQRLPTGRRKDVLAATADEVFAIFSDHVLAFDVACARPYALIVDGRDRLGRPIDGFDAQIAAICRAQGATLATRNTADFDDTGVDVLNPWAGT